MDKAQEARLQELVDTYNASEKKIQQLKKEALRGDSFTVSPETWEVFLDPAKAVKKVYNEITI